MILIQESAFVEDKRRPRGHVALQEGWTPFDEIKWKKPDEEYRASILRRYLPNPPPDLGRVYEERPAAFIERTKGEIRTVYRAIRIRVQDKNFGHRPEIQRRGVPPEGDLFPDLRSQHMERMAAYQRLQHWPQDRSIMASDPDADLLPVQHVSGDDYAAQYISCSLDFARSRRCALTSYTLQGDKRQRRPYEWAPVIQIDLARLPEASRIVDLTTVDARIHAGFFELDGRAANVASLAESDREILITGSIPGEAIVQVFDTVSVVKAVDDELYQAIVSSEALRNFAAKDPWRHLSALCQ
jgi:hypothetical protein